jgi:hypothetical protein
MESTVDNRVGIRSCSRQHVFDLFAKFSVFGYRIRPLNGQQLPTIALQHSGAPLTELVWACRQVVTTVKAGLNTVGVFSSDQLISMVPIQMSGRVTLLSSTEISTIPAVKSR